MGRNLYRAFFTAEFIGESIRLINLKGNPFAPSLRDERRVDKVT